MIINAAPAVVNPAPVSTSTGCTRAVPCDTQTFKFASERCNPCFNRFIARFDHLKTTDSPEPIETGPTVLDTFEPTHEQDAEYLALVATDEDRDAIMADWKAADDHADWVAAFAPSWDLMSDAEIRECGGHHPAEQYLV
jgi:hypothetical protein